MDNVILLKRSSVPSFTPSVTSLSAGELAINVSDGIIFTKRIVNGVEGIVAFSNNNTVPYKYIPALSAIQPADDATQNTVTQSFGTVLGGYYNDVSGGGSTVINGENNDIAGDYALIGGGLDNLISSSGDYGVILGGKDNTLNHQESFIIGSNITSHAPNFTYVNNLSATGSINGQINASDIVTGTLNAARLPSFTGDITTTVNGSVSATVVAIQGSPISTQTPVNGQALQWTGTAWTPGAIPNGGSGGGGLVYYLNYANEAQNPTTNLSATPNTPKELGITGTTALTSYTLTNVSTTDYDLICGFVSLTASPQTTVIPAGLWDFNIWASATSTVTNQMILRLDVYKYDGSNVPTLLASSGDIYIYDPITTGQYIASVVFPQTTLLTTDRIYIELRAKGTQNNKNVTIYFGGTSPTHVHTTFPSVGGSGLLKVINGVYQSPASLLVNTDVAANAAIDQYKINGLTDVASKANSVYTIVQNNSATNWDNNISNQYTHLNFLPLSGGTITGNLSVLGDITYFDTSVGVTSAMYIDTDTSETALRITQRGIGDVIRIEDFNNPDSTPFIINSDGVVGIGTSVPNQKLTISGNTSATGIVYSEEFAYNSTERPDLTGIKQALDELLYLSPVFNSLIVTGGNSLEVGQSLSTPAITWTTNKTFNSITLTYPNGTTSTGTGSFLSINDTSSYTYTTTTGSKTWTVQGVDWKAAIANRSTTVNWYYRVYMGAFNTVTPSSSDVLSNLQHSTLGSSRTILGSKSIILNNEYFYVAYPSSFGVTSQLKVNGLNFTDLASVYTITPFTNAYGGTTNYYVYRTNNKLTGTYTMEVL